jgi:hypothetical protein
VASGTAAVERNTFTLNIAVLYGGAICVLDSTEGVIIRNNDLRNNYSWYAGGGICCRNSLCAIVNNLFIDNQAKGPGGAAWLGEDGQYMVANNTVSENYALHGGAVAFDSGAQAEVVGNIFWADTGTNGGAEVSITDSQFCSAGATSKRATPPFCWATTPITSTAIACRSLRSSWATARGSSCLRPRV